jgi:hypothetical protein
MTTGKGARSLAETPRPTSKDIELKVREFGALVLAKLLVNSHKPGWYGDSMEDLFARLDEEVAEFKEAVAACAARRGSRIAAACEGADVGAFAMMIVDCVLGLGTEWSTTERAVAQNIRVTEARP